MDPNGPNCLEKEYVPKSTKNVTKWFKFGSVVSNICPKPSKNLFGSCSTKQPIFIGPCLFSEVHILLRKASS